MFSGDRARDVMLAYIRFIRSSHCRKHWESSSGKLETWTVVGSCCSVFQKALWFALLFFPQRLPLIDLNFFSFVFSDFYSPPYFAIANPSVSRKTRPPDCPMSGIAGHPFPRSVSGIVRQTIQASARLFSWLVPWFLCRSPF